MGECLYKLSSKDFFQNIIQNPEARNFLKKIDCFDYIKKNISTW